MAERILNDLPSLNLDLATKQVIERWLATDKEFNVWFLATTKRSLDDDDLMGLLDGYRETQESAESAWRAFRTGPSDTTALRTGLDASAAKMRALMKE